MTRQFGLRIAFILPILAIGVALLGCERQDQPVGPASQPATTVRPVEEFQDADTLRAKLRDVDKRLEADPDNVAMRVERATLQMTLGDLCPLNERQNLYEQAWDGFAEAHELAGGKWDFPDPFEAARKALRDPSSMARLKMKSKGSATGSLDALLGGARLAGRLQMFGITAQLVSRAAEIDPRHPLVRVLQASSQGIVGGDYRAAAVDLDAMSKEDGLRDSPDLWHSLGVALQHSGKPGQAVYAYRRALQLAPGREGSATNLAILLGEMGEHEEERTVFEGIVARNKYALFAYNNFGMSLCKQHRYEEAVALLKPVMERDPGLPAGWLNLATAYMGVGDYAAAITALEQVRRLMPTAAEPLHQLGRAYRLWGKPEQALQAFDGAIELSPAISAGALHEAGLALLDLRRDDEAEQRFRDAARRSPQSGRSLVPLGILLLKQDRYADAREALTAAMKIGRLSGEEEAQAVHYLAYLELETGNAARAVEVMQGWYNRHRDSELVWGEMCMLLYRAEQRDEAEAFLAEGLANHPRWPMPLIIRGGVHQRAGRLRDAVEDCGRAIALRAGYQTLMTRGYLHWALGEAGLAQADFRAALEQYPSEPHAALCVWLLEPDREAAGPVRKALATALERFGPGDWGGALARYYTGELSADDLVKAARDQDQRSEACFYIAERLRLDSGPVAAAAWYQRVVAESDPGCLELQVAKMRLGGVPDSQPSPTHPSEP